MAPERTDVRQGNRLTGEEEIAPVRALSAELIDYAGLFPPAQLPMPAAVHNFRHYLELPFSWLLGRFILPAARLEEFEVHAQPRLLFDTSPCWRLSLLSAEPAHDIERLLEFNRRYAGARFDSIEIKTGSAAEIEAAASVIPPAIQLYCEIPLHEGMLPLLAAIHRVKARAKIRCGGVTPDAFPSAERLAAFLHACGAANVSFKATAGLHHPVRGLYPLTYEADSPKGLMHGFLNLFLAASWVHSGCTIGETVECLEERSASAFQFDDLGVRWRDRLLSSAEILEARRTFAVGFGSCSFSEPVSDLRNLNLIP
jgi:hypothetical protein